MAELRSPSQLGHELRRLAGSLEILGLELEGEPLELLSLEAARAVAERIDNAEKILNGLKVGVVDHKRAALRERAQGPA